MAYLTPDILAITRISHRQDAGRDCYGADAAAPMTFPLRLERNFTGGFRGNARICRMASVLLGLLWLGRGSDEVAAEADKRGLCLD